MPGEASPAATPLGTDPHLFFLCPSAAQRTMGYSAPGAVVAVVLSSTFLIKSIYRRHGEQRSSKNTAHEIHTSLQFSC